MVYSALLCSSSSIAQPYDLDRRERFRALGDADLQPTLSPERLHLCPALVVLRALAAARAVLHLPGGLKACPSHKIGLGSLVFHNVLVHEALQVSVAVLVRPAELVQGGEGGRGGSNFGSGLQNEEGPDEGRGQHHNYEPAVDTVLLEPKYSLPDARDFTDAPRSLIVLVLEKVGWGPFPWSGVHGRQVVVHLTWGKTRIYQNYAQKKRVLFVFFALFVSLMFLNCLLTSDRNFYKWKLYSYSGRCVR